MIPDILNGFLGGIAAALGGVFLFLLRRWITAPDRERQRAVEDSKLAQADQKNRQLIKEENDKVATALREELRRDNAILRQERDEDRKRYEENDRELRQRIRDTEAKGVANEARINDLRSDNDKLRQENLVLTAEKAHQAAMLKAYAERVSTLEFQVSELEQDRDILIAALQKANIPLPKELYRRGDRKLPPEGNVATA